MSKLQARFADRALTEQVLVGRPQTQTGWLGAPVRSPSAMVAKRALLVLDRRGEHLIDAAAIEVNNLEFLMDLDADVREDDALRYKGLEYRVLGVVRNGPLMRVRVCLM